ncbi:MAG: hypothetical protein J2P16_07180 [Mycobacterium sp.]|nr:hypothetical protein [Mycobacterium sp.]
MTDWSESPEWHAYADRVLNELLPMIESTAVTAQLVTASPPDVKIAVELGMSILLDKPLVLVVYPGATVPDHLMRAADALVEVGPDGLTEKVRDRIADAVHRLAGD